MNGHICGIKSFLTYFIRWLLIFLIKIILVLLYEGHNGMIYTLFLGNRSLSRRIYTNDHLKIHRRFLRQNLALD